MLEEHLSYLLLPRRLESYREAARRVVTPDSIVLDAGCGTAVLGIACLEAGAARLYAVEYTSALHVAQESLDRLGYSSKTVAVQGSTFQLELPELVDIVICDHVGFFGFDYGLMALLSDACKRFLKPKGILVPGRLVLQAALVESAELHAKACAWASPKVPAQYHWLRDHGINSKHAVDLVAQDLVSRPVNLCDLDLYQDQPGFHSWTIELVAERDGLVHGLAGWFRTELVPDVWMTNSPLDEASIGRSQAYLPVSEPVQVKQGDVLTATIMARPEEHLIAWTLKHESTGRTQRQSTWLGEIDETPQLRRSQPDHVPQLTTSARARQLIFGYCDGQRTLAQIEDAFLRDHPGYFPTEEEMRRFVRGVLSKDTR